MKFTVVFNSHESCDCSFELVFTPCPIWMKGGIEILNLNPDNPYYQVGSIKKLIAHENLNYSIVDKDCAVIVHNQGYGSEDDLNTLKKDLDGEGFKVSIIRLNR